MGLLLSEQHEFDNVAFNRPEWQVDEWRDQKTRHIGLHISKAALKLVTGGAPVIARQVIPDLSIYRAQLINTHELSEQAATKFTLRLASDNCAARWLIRANGELANYLEPAEHGAITEGDRMWSVLSATQDLHVAVESLGQIHRVDVEQAHHDRLEQLLADH